MKNLPITLSLPEETINDLHLYVSKRQISKFVAETLVKALDHKKKLLAREFQEASLDAERNAEIQIWDTLSGNGLDETNAY